MAEIQQDPQWDFVDGDDNSTPNPMEMLWRRKSLVLLGAVIGLTAGAFRYSWTPPLYRSDAQVLVIKKTPEVVTPDQFQVSQFEDYIATHTILMSSPLIVEKAAASISKAGSFNASAGNPTQAILAGLSVNRGANNSREASDKILTVSFQGPDPEDCATVIQAVLDSYMDFLDETYRNLAQDAQDMFKTARDELRAELQQKERDRAKFRGENPLLSARVDSAAPSPELARLSAIKSQQSELLLRQTLLTAQLQTISEAQRTGQSRRELLSLVKDLAEEAQIDIEQFERQKSAETMQDKLLPLLQEEQMLLQNLGRKHPLVETVRHRIELTRKFLADQEADTDESDSPSDLDSQKRDPVAAFVRTLEHKLNQVETTHGLLEKAYQDQFDKAKEFSGDFLEDDRLTRDIERTQVLYDGVVNQLQGADLVKDRGGVEATIISPPRHGSKVAPRLSNALAVAMALGLALGFGMAYLAEMTDKRFGTPEDIHRELNYPVMGHLPLLEPVEHSSLKCNEQGVPLDANLHVLHAPDSAITEAYRGLRTSLFFSNRGQDHKVIQVTSPTMGDGKSTVASNLAISIAQAGKTVLLIDADMRRPRQHKIFCIPGDTGLSLVIGRDGDLSDAIQPTIVPNLSILPSGPTPADPSEALTTQRFPELLDAVRIKYDYVLVDTGPVLAISDPSIVAPRVDSVLLTIRLSKNSRTQAKQARDVLNDVDAKVLGVVVNAVSESGTRSYSGYRYSSGYRYGYRRYGYTSNYRSDAARSGEQRRPVASSSSE